MVGLFASWAGLLLPYCGPMILGRSVGTGLIEILLRLAYVQFRALLGILGASHAHAGYIVTKRYSRKNIIQQDN